MSPQFVDLDADGHVDIVAGTFSGSPWIARGTAKGWTQPEMILDRDGERIVGNQFWNYETKQWDETERCDPDGGAPERSHLTSAWAQDVDGDGDRDLLLGDYDGGYVYLRRNEGSDAEPAFATRNELVHAGGEPLNVGKTGTPRVLDWNGDGRPDLLVSSMGDTYGDRPGGGVFLYPGLPSDGDLRFGERVTLVLPSPKGRAAPERPDAGLYADAGDVDGDGALDLVVGGYSMWSPPKRKLNAEERSRVTALRDRLAEVEARMRALNEALSEAAAGISDREERDRVREKALEGQSEERSEVYARRRELMEAIDELDPGDQRKPFVWLYASAGAGRRGAGR